MTGQTPSAMAICAVGDIHRRLGLLTRIYKRIAADARQRAVPHKVMAYLGGYVSRGEDSRRILNKSIVVDEDIFAKWFRNNTS